MSNLWFSSDYHFGHQNIMKFCASSRPFNSVKEMDEAIIERHNALVKNGDEFWFLGDFTFHRDDESITKLFKALNGNKHLIKGNHDHNDVTHLPWASVHDYYEIKNTEKKVILFHYPIVEHNRERHNKEGNDDIPRNVVNFHLYGHVHSTKLNPYVTPNKWSHDIGFDRNEKPVNYDELVRHFESPYL